MPRIEWGFRRRTKRLPSPVLHKEISHAALPQTQSVQQHVAESAVSSPSATLSTEDQVLAEGFTRQHQSGKIDYVWVDIQKNLPQTTGDLAPGSELFLTNSTSKDTATANQTK
jgi:hypothetical protein